MLAEDRLQYILKILDQKDSVTVLELTELLNTSESTIRRDLTELHKQGLLNKVHGGAVAISAKYLSKDSDLSFRQELNREEKALIAKYCASIMDKDDFIYLDAGTTTELIIDYLTEKSLTFVTNGINIGRKLAARGYKVYLLSGELKTSTEAVVGSDTMECLEKYNFTKGFFGVNGISIQSGCTTPEISEALVKKKAITKCKLKYIVCDSSKFNQTAPITFASFDKVQIITSNIKETGYENFEHITEVERL